MIVGVWARGRVPIGTLLHSIKACDFLMTTHLFGPFLLRSGCLFLARFHPIDLVTFSAIVKIIPEMTHAWFIAATIYLST